MDIVNKTDIVTEFSYSSKLKLVPYPWLSHPVTLIIILICAVGNISIFALVCLSKTFRRPSNYLIANLCVASVYFISVFTFYNFRSEGILHLWEYSPTVCSTLGVIQRLCLPVVPYNIMLISLDRSKAARNPLEHTTNRTILIQIVCMWLLGLAIVLPRGMINQYDENLEGSYKCRKVSLGGSPILQTIYAVVVLTFVYLIPFYILIKEFITLRSKMKFLTLSQVEQKKRFQHRLRLMQNSCIFTAIFITCWLPQGVFQFPFDLPAEMTEKFRQYLIAPQTVSRQVALLNTCLNPILLLLLSFDVREYLASCSLV
ncbi:unnamed protein product [Orchesella dallaii]|uniref:G-protein coupled receptors family 1 profile domain-containing protein n=1 Tax=Orchesella dallaii TaxID=48710 RepID=A0ABP1QPK9_9HEXA